MKNLNVPPQWQQVFASGKLPSSQNGRALVGRKDRARDVLRLMPPLLYRPNLISLASIDAGLHLSGAECLKLAQVLASQYCVIVDGLCGDGAPTALPDALCVANDPEERTRIVGLLDQLLAAERAESALS